MDVSTIITRSRRFAYVNSTDYTDAMALQDLNIIKDQFWSEIVTRLPEDYQWETWTATTVSLQWEYELPQPTSTSVWATVIKAVAISYSSDTYRETGLMQYTKAREVNPATLQYEWNYYCENQSQEDPIYYVADDSVFVAPMPLATEVWANRLKLTGIRNIVDYTIVTTEANTKIPVSAHEVLVQGLIYYALLSKRVPANESNAQYASYLKIKADNLRFLAERVENPTQFAYPDNIGGNAYGYYNPVN